jgi:hypothetical protein
MRQALEGGPGQDLVVTVELVMTRADDIIGTRRVNGPGQSTFTRFAAGFVAFVHDHPMGGGQDIHTPVNTRMAFQVAQNYGYLDRPYAAASGSEIRALIGVGAVVAAAGCLIFLEVCGGVLAATGEGAAEFFATGGAGTLNAGAAAGGSAAILGVGAAKVAGAAGEASGVDAAAAAAVWQGGEKYPGVDAWTNVTLKAGTLIHAGEPHVSGFFASDTAAASIGNDATALNQGLQAAPFQGTYRPGLTAFRLTRDVQAARSVALMNPQFGPGGLEQYYIPNWQGVTEPVVTRLMTNTVVK